MGNFHYNTCRVRLSRRGCWCISGCVEGKGEPSPRIPLKKLTDFYSPLLAIRKELKAMRDIELKVSRAADTAWRKLCDGYEGDPNGLRKVTDERRDAFTKIIDHDNEYLERECIPSYHRMVDVFRKNIWLAEPSTVAYFPYFTGVHRRLGPLSGGRLLPEEVVQELNHSEESLQPFYD